MLTENKIFQISIIVIIGTTLLIGALIASNLIRGMWTRDLVQLSLEKGQNPMYAKCAMESNSSNECKTLVTALAVGK